MPSAVYEPPPLSSTKNVVLGFMLLRYSPSSTLAPGVPHSLSSGERVKSTWNSRMSVGPVRVMFTGMVRHGVTGVMQSVSPTAATTLLPASVKLAAMEWPAVTFVNV